MAIIFAEVKTRFSLPLFFFPKTLKTKKLPKNDEETKEIQEGLRKAAQESVQTIPV